MFNDLFEKIHSLRLDIIMAIKEQEQAHVTASAEVTTHAQVTSPKSVEDAEKWKNLVSMTSVVPRGW
jgi:hypothetical protein